MSKIHFHIGLPKTATTSLQASVFPLSHYRYIGKFNGTSIQECGFANDMKPAQLTYLFKTLITKPEAFIGSSRCQEMFLEGNASLPSGKSQMALKRWMKEYENVLLSEESITGFSLIPLMNSFAAISKEVIPIESRNHDHNLLQIFEHGSNFVMHTEDYPGSWSQVLKKAVSRLHSHDRRLLAIAKFFGFEVGNVMFVKRDFGSWFVSLMYSVLPTGISGVDIRNVFYMAGALSGLRKLCYQKGVDACFPDLIETRMNSSGYCATPHVVEYSSDKSEFAHRISPALVHFGINDFGSGINLTNSSHNVSNYSEKFSGKLDFLASANEHKALLTQLYTNAM